MGQPACTINKQTNKKHEWMKEYKSHLSVNKFIQMSDNLTNLTFPFFFFYWCKVSSGHKMTPKIIMNYKSYIYKKIF